MSYHCKSCTKTNNNQRLDDNQCNTPHGMGKNTITENKINMVVRCDEYDLNKVSEELTETLKDEFPSMDDVKTNDLRTRSGYVSLGIDVLNPNLTDDSDNPDDYKASKISLLKINENNAYQWYFKKNGKVYKLPQDFVRKNLYEQLSRIEQSETPVDEKIQTLLGKIRFYGVKDYDEGFLTKEIDFNTEQITNIKRNYLEFKEDGYDEDDSFVRAVIETMGIDKSGKPVVRLFSFDDQSNISIVPDITTIREAKGLATLLKETIVYFTVDKSTKSPDSRDVKIMKGNLLKSKLVEPKKPETKQVEMRPPQPEAKKEEPSEMVMREKEQKGLSSLLNTGKSNSDLTRKQKEIVEKLKRNGYKFSKPQNEEMYEMKNIKTSEFNEGIKVWKPKK